MRLHPYVHSPEDDEGEQPFATHSPNTGRPVSAGGHTKGRQVWFVSEVRAFLREEIEEAADAGARARLQQSFANYLCEDQLLCEGLTEEAARAEARLRFPPLYEGGTLRADWRSLIADGAAPLTGLTQPAQE